MLLKKKPVFFFALDQTALELIPGGLQLPEHPVNIVSECPDLIFPAHDNAGGKVLPFPDFIQSSAQVRILESTVFSRRMSIAIPKTRPAMMRRDTKYRVVDTP